MTLDHILNLIFGCLSGVNTPLNFDLAVLITSLNFYLTAPMTPLSPDSAASSTFETQQIRDRFC
jgi:hypothetical protein